MGRLANLLFVLISLMGFLGACGSGDSTREAIAERGELRFITRNGPTTYYLGRDGAEGFEYDLARELAKELDVELTIIPAFTLDALFTALDRNEADIAGAGLTLTPQRRDNFSSTRPYAHQRPQIIYKVGERKPRSLEDLKGLDIVVMAGSSHEALLQRLQAENLPELRWTSVDVSDPTTLLLMLNEDEADVAVVDSRDFFIQQNLVPRVALAFDLAEERDIVWYLGLSARDSELMAYIDGFLERKSADGTLERLQQRYFYRDSDISRIDSQTFLNSVRRDLGSYQQLIQIVAREEELPWELLAAISYQESHWDPKATSRTGVRGMMMLTRATAKDLDVDDRTDAGESLRGGARYFKDLRRRLPDDIDEPDRSWMALAAYNIGMGHLADARVLTERRGGDPHLWSDVMDVLPLLQESQHYNTLRHGYARGLEAFRYVQNIRHYYNILQWQSARDKEPQPPEDPSQRLPQALQPLRLQAL